MPAINEPRSGLKYGWDLGEGGWKPDMDANILWLGRFGTHLSVISRTLTAPPATPAVGDTYIPAAAASGAWAGLHGMVVVWSGTAWVSGVPRQGWLAWIEAESRLVVRTASAWSTGIAL